MGFKILWSQFAESQLQEIYHYYENKVSSRVAVKLIKGIINEPIKLLTAPYIGQSESLLSERKIQYRYLIFKNFKLIYSVDEEAQFIKIVDVFDTRRNPTIVKRM